MFTCSLRVGKNRILRSWGKCGHFFRNPFQKLHSDPSVVKYVCLKDENSQWQTARFLAAGLKFKLWIFLVIILADESESKMYGRLWMVFQNVIQDCALHMKQNEAFDPRENSFWVCSGKPYLTYLTSNYLKTLHCILPKIMCFPHACINRFNLQRNRPQEQLERCLDATKRKLFHVICGWFKFISHRSHHPTLQKHA